MSGLRIGIDIISIVAVIYAEQLYRLIDFI